MPETAVVETNWLLDVVLDQHTASMELMRLARTERLTLFIPAFCLPEAVKALERKQSERALLVRDMRKLADELKRSPASADIAIRLHSAAESVTELDDVLRTRMQGVLGDVTSSVQLLEMTPDIVAQAGEIADQLNLTLADSVVLASVALARARCGEFISRDESAFKTNAEVGAFLRGRGIRYYSDPAHFIAAHFPDARSP